MSCRAPALGPALLLVGSVIVARQVGDAGLWWVITLLLVTTALARGWRLLAAAAALGWLVGALEPVSDGCLRQLAPSRPVELRGELAAPWRPSGAGWGARLKVSSIIQGELVVTHSPRLGVFLAGEERPPAGSRVHLRGYLRAPRSFLNGPGGRRGDWRVSVSSRRLLRTHGGAWEPVAHWVERVRGSVERRLERRSNRGSPLARALLLGDTSALSERHLTALRRLGLGHLVAVSGLHLGLLALVAWVCTAPLGYRGRLAVVAVVVLSYLVVVGPRPSLLRSSIMALTALLSLAVERRPEALNCWALAVAAMVVGDPTLTGELAFQLTAVATVGLISMTPALSELAPRGRRSPLVTGLAASVAAHIATLPWSVAVFHLWSPAALPLNLVAVVWTTVTLPLGVLAVALEPLPGVGDLAWRLFGGMAAPYGWLARLPAGPPWSFAVARPFWSVAVVSLCLGLAIRRRAPRAFGALGIATCLYLSPSSTAWVARRMEPPASAGADAPELVVLDVGQGESVLVRDGPRALLVDGGGWRHSGIGQRVLLPALLRLGLDRLDGVVLTHPDRDHCAGLTELASLIPVRRVWATPGWEHDCYRELIRLPGVTLSPLWSGRRLAVGRWSLEVVHPRPGWRPRGNDSSLALRVSTLGWFVLMTGDAGHAVERALMERHPGRLAAAVIKVGHHGSRWSTHPSFLSAVAPRVAVISAGRHNIYGHPTEEVLASLDQHGADVWRTDLGGQIRLRFSPGEIRVDQPWGRAAATVSYNSRHGANRRHGARWRRGADRRDHRADGDR